MRSHVFPVCSTGFLNIDSDFSNNSSKLNVNPNSPSNINKFIIDLDKKSVFLFVFNNELRAIYVYNFGEYSEFLNSIDEEKLDDILSNTGSMPYTSQGGRYHTYSFSIANQRLNQGSSQETIRSLANESGVDLKHIPKGLIMCFGSKYESEGRAVHDGAIKTETRFFPDKGAPTDLYNYNPILGTSSSFNNIDVKPTKWITVMFTGTRFVILGSNNWIS